MRLIRYAFDWIPKFSIQIAIASSSSHYALLQRYLKYKNELCVARSVNWEAYPYTPVSGPPGVKTKHTNFTLFDQTSLFG
jgi:hypothetical protein